MATSTRRSGWAVLASVLALALTMGIASGTSAFAHGGGGGGHGGGGFGGYGGYGRGFGYGGLGYGGYGLGYGYGYPYYGYGGYGYGGLGYGGLGYGGYGYGGLGYGGLGYGGLGYGGYGYGYPYNGYGYSYPYYGYGYGYPYASSYPTMGSTFGYTSAYVAPGGGQTIGSDNGAGQGLVLGIDERQVVDPSGRKGMQITRVYPGTPAEKAGLHEGDVIHSVNSYLTEVPGNLAWIITNAARDNVLKMVVRTAKDGREYTYTATLR